MVRAMMDYYRLTGEQKFLKGIPAAIDFLRSQRLPDEVARRYTYYRPITEGFLAPRFLLPEDGTPMYVHRRGSNVGNGEYYTDGEISGTIAHYGSCAFINPDALEHDYHALMKANVKPRIDEGQRERSDGLLSPALSEEEHRRSHLLL